MVYRYLILFEKGQVTVADYERKQGKGMAYITREGEKTFPVTDDFWSWWKDAVSYIAGEPVDLCILYDKDPGILEHHMETVKVSAWNRENVEEYIMAMTDYSLIGVVTADGRELMFKKRDQMFSDHTVAGFCTNLSLDMREEERGEKNGTEEQPVFARFCQGLLEERKAAQRKADKP